MSKKTIGSLIATLAVLLVGVTIAWNWAKHQIDKHLHTLIDEHGKPIPIDISYEDIHYSGYPFSVKATLTKPVYKLNNKGVNINIASDEDEISLYLWNPKNLHINSSHAALDLKGPEGHTATLSLESLKGVVGLGQKDRFEKANLEGQNLILKTPEGFSAKIEAFHINSSYQEAAEKKYTSHVKGDFQKFSLENIGEDFKKLFPIDVISLDLEEAGVVPEEKSEPIEGPAFRDSTVKGNITLTKMPLTVTADMDLTSKNKVVNGKTKFVIKETEKFIDKMVQENAIAPATAQIYKVMLAQSKKDKAKDEIDIVLDFKDGKVSFEGGEAFPAPTEVVETEPTSSH
jgi:hypothetical protein